MNGEADDDRGARTIAGSEADEETTCRPPEGKALAGCGLCVHCSYITVIGVVYEAHCESKQDVGGRRNATAACVKHRGRRGEDG